MTKKTLQQAKELLKQATKYIAKGVESGVYGPTVGGDLFAERLYEQINRFTKAKAPRLADANDLLKRAAPYIAKGIESGAYTATVGGDLFADRLLKHIYSYTNVRGATAAHHAVKSLPVRRPTKRLPVHHSTKKSPAQLDAEIAEALGQDRSTHPNAVEYAVQDLFKGKTPKKAAERTAKKLSGQPNMFLGVHPPNVVKIDARQLEDAVWDRIVDFTLKGVTRFKPDKAHYALDGAIQHFRQLPGLRAELKRRVITRLGRDPFEGLE